MHLSTKPTKEILKCTYTYWWVFCIRYKYCRADCCSKPDSRWRNCKNYCICLLVVVSPEWGFHQNAAAGS